MLKNEQQLAGARKKLRALQDALELETDVDGQRSLGYLIADVQREISEYEGVRDGSIRTFAIRSLDDLGPALVKVRIARGISQHELAAELEVSDQQVSKDESREYETAGVTKLADVLDVLDYELVGEVRPKSDVASVDTPLEQSLTGTLATPATAGPYFVFHFPETALTSASTLQQGRVWGGSCLQAPLRVERAVPHAYSSTTDIIKALDREAEGAH